MRSQLLSLNDFNISTQSPLLWKFYDRVFNLTLQKKIPPMGVVDAMKMEKQENMCSGY